MNIEEIQESIEEAKKFIKRAEIAIKDLKEDEFNKFNSSQVAAMRRTSMDLTRSLVKIRQIYS